MARSILTLDRIPGDLRVTKHFRKVDLAAKRAGLTPYELHVNESGTQTTIVWYADGDDWRAGQTLRVTFNRRGQIVHYSGHDADDSFSGKVSHVCTSVRLLDSFLTRFDPRRAKA